MGFFKRLAAILPANGVKTRFQFAFRDAQGELYERLVFAWSKALEPYASRPEGIFNEDRIQTGRLLCRFFATVEDFNAASTCAAISLACMSYPAFANVPDNRPVFDFLVNALGRVQNGDAYLLEEKFARVNPSSANRISEAEGSVFQPDATNFLGAFLLACGPK